MGVVGLGVMGRRHAEAYRRLAGARLTAVATPDAERRAEAAAAYRVAAFADYRELLPHVDAVSVAAPTALHAEVAEYFIRAGVHVLVEKPMAATEAEAARMVAAAREAGVCLMVGHVERFNPAMVRLAAEAALPVRQGPAEMRAYRMAPFDGRGCDVDVTLDLMIHDVDLACMVHPGTRWRVIQSQSMAVVTPLPDVALATAELEGGGAPPLRVRLLASRVADARRRVVEVQAEGFFGRADLLDQRVWISDERGGLRELPVRREASLDLEVAHFVDSVRSGTRPIVSGEDGARALLAGLALMQRAAEG